MSTRDRYRKIIIGVLVTGMLGAAAIWGTSGVDFDDIVCETNDYYSHCHPPAEICSTQWAVIYTNAGVFASSCINGEVNERKLFKYRDHLKEKCDATSGCVWSKEGI